MLNMEVMMRKSYLFIVVIATIMYQLGWVANAYSRGYEHSHRHYASHSNYRWGAYVAAPLLLTAPLWAAPRYSNSYYSSPVVVQERVIVQPTTVYSDRLSNLSMPAQVNSPAPMWYYCPDSQAYYPYAQTCNMPWQSVAPR